MLQINELTPEQIAKFPEYVKKWTDIGLCTEPANRIEAEKAINESYRLAGLNPPKKIVWCGSPLSQGLVRAIILDKSFIKNIGISVEDSVRNSVGASVRGAVLDSIGASAWNSVGDSVVTYVSNYVWDSVNNSVMTSVRASLEDYVGNSVENSVWDSLSDSVRDSVINSVGDSVRNSVRDSVRESVRNSVWDSVGDSIRDSIEDSIEDSVRASGYGQHDANWLSFFSFFRNECGLLKETEKLNGLMELAKHAGWFLPHENICWVSERHCILNRDDEGRLHSLTEAAIDYPDGWKIYAVHGVRLPGWIIEEPEKITIELIEKEENSEIRRVMTDIYGLERYMKNCGAHIIHEDKNGQLFKKEINGDEPIIMVKVINSTAEPNGEFKTYFLRVPPNITNTTEAIAWTFDMKKDEYVPQIET